MSELKYRQGRAASCLCAAQRNGIKDRRGNMAGLRKKGRSSTQRIDRIKEKARAANSIEFHPLSIQSLRTTGERRRLKRLHVGIAGLGGECSLIIEAYEEWDSLERAIKLVANAKKGTGEKKKIKLQEKRSVKQSQVRERGSSNPQVVRTQALL